MKILIVFYSLEGHTKFVADVIREELDCDLLQLKPEKAGRYTPSINTFISENKIKEKNVAFFACHGGGGSKKCFDKLQDVLKDNTILGTIDFVDSEDETEKREKVKQWISSIKVFK